MSVVVVNRFDLDVPVEDLVERIRHEFPPAFDACRGFERFELVKTGERSVVVLIHWSDSQAAMEGAAAIGPTAFNAVIAPHLASEQDRVAGGVVVAHKAAR